MFYLSAISSFCFSILLAWVFDWKSIDLFWCLLLSSFFIGYSIIFIGFFRGWLLDRLNTNAVGKAAIMSGLVSDLFVITLLYIFIYSFIAGTGEIFFSKASEAEKIDSLFDVIKITGPL